MVFNHRDSPEGESFELPCGQCVGCRLERSRQWAMRCVHEASLHEENCFLTLTYDDEHLPVRIKSLGPKARVQNSLILSDYQDFMKRLRKKYGSGIRFFHCGEYGDALGRPHYHAVIFNHDFPDKVLHRVTPQGHRLYTSESLEKLWPNGFALIGDVTFESAAYVARYVMKKVTGEPAAAHYQGRKPEYTTMSRRPGIGRGWYDKYKAEVYPFDEIIVNSKPVRPPRFYDNLLDKEDPDLLQSLKERRKQKAVKSNPKAHPGKRVTVHHLTMKEQCKLASISSLKRHSTEFD